MGTRKRSQWRGKAKKALWVGTDEWQWRSKLGWGKGENGIFWRKKKKKPDPPERKHETRPSTYGR